MPSRDPGHQGKGRASTTGGVNPYGANQENWRKKLKASRLKFDDEAKQVFLRMWVETGAIGMSARAAGVSIQTVRDHDKIDPDFAESWQEAKVSFNEKLEAVVLKLATEGEDKLHIGRVGKDEDGIIAKQKQIVFQAVVLELKRRNPEYKDKSTVDLNVKSTPLMVPAPMTAEEWNKMFARPKPDSHNGS